MESTGIVHSSDLQRDWIVGCDGSHFLKLVQENVRFLCPDKLDTDAVRGQLLVIDEEDPIVFAAMFFAAVSIEMPVALANPHWKETEWQQFNRLVEADEAAQGMILIPTGGTTGGVKLAIHNWKSLRSAACGLQAFLGGGPIDSCCLLPLFHVSGLMQLIRSFVTGGTIRFDDAETKGYCLSLVPTQLQRALKDELQIAKLRQARAIFVGGAAIPQSVSEAARKLQLPILPVYGMTETAAMIAAVPSEDFLRDDDPGALPIGEANISIESDGRICIASPALFQGYFGQPKLDLSRGFIVNDEGRLDRDGRLHVLGRMDRLINTGGEKVDPSEVERYLLKIEGVEEALVLGEPDVEWGHAVVAYVVVGSATVDGSMILERLRAVLAPFKVPKAVRVVEKLPLNDLGKTRLKQ